MLQANRHTTFAQPPVVSVKDLEADPHGLFRRYRAAVPVIMREDGSFLVLRARDSERLLSDRRLRQAETEFSVMRGITEGVLFAIFEHGMLTSNGVVHQRRRSPFTRTFALRMVTALRPKIRQAAHALLDGWQDGRTDFVDRYAAQLPARVISEILGLSRSDIPHFTRCVYEVTRVLGFTFGPRDVPRMERAAKTLYRYVEQVLAERRARPTRDLLSSFLADAESHGDLSPTEVVIQIMIVIIGGTDTTRVAMANLAALLLDRRELWEAVREKPGLIPGAVTESLRFEPSVGSVGRVTVEDLPLDDFLLPAGSLVSFSLLSAMRDEAVYAEPDRFDILREDHPRVHPVFGAGAHRCLGESLAKAELEEGLAVLLERFPQLELAAGLPTVSGHVGIRRIGPMPVRWR